MSMIKQLVIVSAIFLGVALAPRSASAHTPNLGNGKFGIGLVFGHPDGLTMEGRLSYNTSVALAIGFDSFSDRSLYTQIDYQVRLFRIVHNRTLAMPLYLGLGGFLFGHNHAFKDKYSDDLHLGVRVPLGIALEFEPPIQIFFELSGNWILAEINHTDTHAHGFGLGGAIGFRLFF